MRIILLALLASLNVTGCGGGSSSSSGNGDTALVNTVSNAESSGEVCSDVETLSSGNYDSVIAKWKTLDQIERRGPARMVAVGSSSIRYWRSLFPNFSKWDSPELKISVKNILRREYSSLFALIFSFTVLDGIGNYLVVQKLYVVPVWNILFWTTFAAYLILRFLKRHSNFLDVKGR